MNYKGYEIRSARPTGGKAGRGLNKTSTIQVLLSNQVMKAFRFKVGDAASFDRATTTAKAFVDWMVEDAPDFRV